MMFDYKLQQFNILLNDDKYRLIIMFIYASVCAISKIRIV